jgi:hypothetical protein
LYWFFKIRNAIVSSHPTAINLIRETSLFILPIYNLLTKHKRSLKPCYIRLGHKEIYLGWIVPYKISYGKRANIRRRFPRHSLARWVWPPPDWTGKNASPASIMVLMRADDNVSLRKEGLLGWVDFLVA